MKPRLTSSARSLALQFYEVGSASLGLFFGVYTVRGLIRLARMVPTRPSAAPNCGQSANADVDTQTDSRRAGAS